MLPAKGNLVDYGFRLPAAMDNRPLTFRKSFNLHNQQTIYVSATPADYELQKSQGSYHRTGYPSHGLLDPTIEVRPSLNQNRRFT